MPEAEESLVEPVTPANDNPRSITDIQLRVDTDALGHGAAGIPMVDPEQDVSKDDVMLRLDKSVVPIPDAEK